MQALPPRPVAPDEAIPPRVKDKSPYRHMMAHRMDRMNQDNRNGSNECVGVGKKYHWSIDICHTFLYCAHSFTQAMG